MKGADMETDIWKIRVQLMKPVTWIPLIWGALCVCGLDSNTCEVFWVQLMKPVTWIPLVWGALCTWCIIGNSWHWCHCIGCSRAASCFLYSTAGVLCGAAASLICMLALMPLHAAHR